MKRFTLLFAVLLSIAGTMKAQKALPYSYGFENNDLDAEGWTKTITTSLSNNNKECGINTAAKKTGSYGFRFSSANTSGANAQHLISPELNGSNGVNVSFYYKSSNTGTYGTESFKVGYSTTDTDVNSFTWGEENTTNAASWLLYEESFPAGTKYVAIYYYSNYKYRLFVDDFSFSAPANGPALAVADGSTTINSGYNYNFGLATPGTPHYFTLSNPGTESITLNISATDGFGISNTSLSLEAKASCLLTVTMADATATGTVTITPTASGIDPFVINVSGTIADPNKVFETLLTGSIPEGWTSSGTWTWSTTNGASNSAYYESYNYRIITPKLTVAEGETFYFDAQGKYSGYQGVKLEYSTDGTNWIASGTTTTLTSDWQTFAINDIPAGKYYIALHGWQCNIRNFYGGELPVEPKMVVTQPASLDYSIITESTTKTFTIANTGKATLEGISVTSSNSSIFAISGAPTSLAAGESAEVTITMAATTIGNLSSEITVSATDMEDVKFTVTGTVLPTGLSIIDFNDNQLPARWENTGWTFNNGAAYAAYHNPAYVMTTPKIVVNDGDMFVIKGKIEYNSSSYYVTVKGLNSNNEEVYSKKLTNDVFNNTNYTAVLLSDIPATVEKLQFVGYYGYIDEIQGINYAAALSVTTGNPAAAVETPATYDFGESAADATVTYSFANAGAGSIDITNVVVSGSDAYTTNWTESVAAPFDLVITRTYDATREGASEAVVTVTTTEGDFVINVTGTDKAANAPELAVSPAEDAAFGVVTAAAEKTYTVTNAGTGLLTVNIYSSDAKFTVAPAQLTDIAAGESQTFNVTFTPVAETYGTFTAEIVVVPTYDESAAVPFNASAKVKDPNIWSEDFAANAAPTGWDAGSNWSFTNGVAKAAYAYGSTSYLTTPTLTVADASDELTFDYKATNNYVTIKIQMSQDGDEFIDYQTISGLNNGNAGTHTITGLEAGNYQFRFANDDYELDNFEGFKLNLADHIAIISASSIPESSSWNVTMKEGRSFEATVTVKEMRGVAEELTAKLYMGDEVIGTATGSVAANSTETLTITATPTAPATSGAQMHIEVEYAGGTLTTDPVTRYVAALTYLVLDETSSDAVVAGTYDHVTLKRTFAEGWNTVCLPFTVSDVEGFFGAGAKAYEFSSYANDELGFSVVTTLTASYPYVVYVPAAITEDIELTDITIASSNAEPWYTRKASTYALYFRGTYAPVAAGEWTKSNESDIIYGLTTEGYIKKAGENASIKGFRAYFDFSASASEVKALRFGDIEVGISGVSEFSESSDAIYNVAGQRIQKMQEGINIVNGKKILK